MNNKGNEGRRCDMYGSGKFISKGLEELFNSFNTASIDAWELALNILLEYKSDKKHFKECYGFDTPEEVLSNSYTEAYKKREKYIEKLRNNSKMKSEVAGLLDKYGREDVLKMIREVGEGK